MAGQHCSDKTGTLTLEDPQAAEPEAVDALNDRERSTCGPGSRQPASGRPCPPGNPRAAGRFSASGLVGIEEEVASGGAVDRPDTA